RRHTRFKCDWSSDVCSSDLNITNQLPNTALIPVDPTIMAGPSGLTVGDLPLNRIATHLHGGLTPWFSDGTPFQWFTPNGVHGPRSEERRVGKAGRWVWAEWK